MASLRFSLTNLIETATLKNGTGGAPARDEESPWLMDYAQNRDRGMVWQQSSGGGFVDVDFDLTGGATNKSVGVLAMLGHRGIPGSAIGVVSCTPQYSTNANGYPPTAASSWTSFPSGGLSLGAGVRDDAAVVTPVSCRYVRFALTVATTFTLGRFFAGTVETDLAVVSSPGYTRKRIIQRLENRMADGTPFLTQFGDPRWEYSLPYRNSNATLFGKLLQVGSQARSFLMLDRDDAAFEAIVREGAFQHSLIFSPADLHDASLELETLP